MIHANKLSLTWRQQWNNILQLIIQKWLKKKRLNNFRWAECGYVLGAVIKELLARTLFQPLPTPSNHFQGYVWQMGRWLKGCIEKTEMDQLSDPHQFSCKSTKVYYWEQVLEGTAVNWGARRLVWSSLSRAKSKCLSVWHIPYIQSISYLCSVDLLPKGHGFLSTDQQTAFSK